MNILKTGIMIGSAFFAGYAAQAGEKKEEPALEYRADLNRDGRVDSKDWAIFSANWGRKGVVRGSNPNELGDYADIDGNGEVGIEDLAIFADKWFCNEKVRPKRELAPWYRSFLEYVGKDPNTFDPSETDPNLYESPANK